MVKRIFDLLFHLVIGVITLWLVLLVVVVILHKIAETQSEETTTSVIVPINDSEVSPKGGLFILKEPFLPDGRNGSPRIVWTPLSVVDFSPEIKENHAEITFQQTVLPDWWYKIALWSKNKRPHFQVTKVVLSE